jgi:hypothetical protein
MMMKMMGHAHKIIENISLKSTAYMSCYRPSYKQKKCSNRLLLGIHKAFGEIYQIFPHDSLFDLVHQFEISVFIVSRNTMNEKTISSTCGPAL